MVSNISNVTAPAAASTPKSGGLGSLDQADFMKLMTVQMQHQDPFEPVDQTAMLAQMASFSQLAGINEMSGTLDQILVRMDANASNQIQE